MNIDPRLQKVTGVSGGLINLLGGGQIVPHAHDIRIGEDTYLSPDLQIGLPGKSVDKFIVGDHCRIYAGTIAPRNFAMGDYSTIHEGVWCYGRADAIIGHNSWFGMRCTLDAEGGFRVGNGFGAGQDTHLWSHIRHGDVLRGCKYLSFGHFWAEDDVWFVGRCTSAPAHHDQFSVALTEANVTKNMGFNTVWGGNPAKDLTDRIGTPYERPTGEDVAEQWEVLRDGFPLDTDDLDFDPVSRTYAKTNSPVEVRFMRYLLPEAKFVPRGDEMVDAWLA